MRWITTEAKTEPDRHRLQVLNFVDEYVVISRLDPPRGFLKALSEETAVSLTQELAQSDVYPRRLLPLIIIKPTPATFSTCFQVVPLRGDVLADDYPFDLTGQKGGVVPVKTSEFICSLHFRQNDLDWAVRVTDCGRPRMAILQSVFGQLVHSFDCYFDSSCRSSETATGSPMPWSGHL